MHLTSFMKRENSGLARTTLELAKGYEALGHKVCIKEPGDGSVIYGLDKGDETDVHTIHSQLNPEAYFDNRPKFLWCHGEPISSVGNGVSMKAVIDLAAKMDAFICMRKDEHKVWSAIKRTYLVPKGIDLEFYKPLEGVTEKLSGSPAVLYVENWRSQRNPLYVVIAMIEVWKRFPKARLHLYNCQDKRMRETFSELIKQGKLWTFVRSLQGPVGMSEINLLYNRADIVVSCLYPLYARSIEAFAAGKAFIGPGYREHDYPYQCELDPDSMAAAIIKCWGEYGKIDFRKWAEDYHDVKETVRQAIAIYERYL